jgi:hypothetical protein
MGYFLVTRINHPDKTQLTWIIHGPRLLQMLGVTYAVGW